MYTVGRNRKDMCFEKQGRCMYERCKSESALQQGLTPQVEKHLQGRPSVGRPMPRINKEAEEPLFPFSFFSVVFLQSRLKA